MIHESRHSIGLLNASVNDEEVLLLQPCPCGNWQCPLHMTSTVAFCYVCMLRFSIQIMVLMLVKCLYWPEFAGFSAYCKNYSMQKCPKTSTYLLKLLVVNCLDRSHFYRLTIDVVSCSYQHCLLLKHSDLVLKYGGTIFSNFFTISDRKYMNSGALIDIFPILSIKYVKKQSWCCAQ